MFFTLAARLMSPNEFNPYSIKLSSGLLTSTGKISLKISSNFESSRLSEF